MAREISGYIKEMLFRHDCVIIPGFGAFIGNYFPARIDRREGLFQPPSRKITFNRHLTGNDGLLIGRISSDLGIGYGEARDIVLEWAEELRRKIFSGNPVAIDYLGTFSLNYESTVIFDPDTTVNYLLTSYGLSAYHRQPVEGFDVRKRALEKHLQPSVSQPSVRSLLARAAVIIPLLVALALVPFNDHLFKGNIEESTLNPLASAELEFNREQIDAGRTATIADGETLAAEPVTTGPAGTDEPPVAGRTDTDKMQGHIRTVSGEPARPEPTAVEKAVQPASVAVDKPAQPEAVAREVQARQSVSRQSHAVVVEEYRYLLIIGSFKGEDNALTMVETLRSQGFDPEVAGGPDGFLRVSAQSYETLDEARTALHKASKNFPGAWVCKSRQ